MEKLGLSSKSFRTSLVVFSIACPLLLLITVWYQNSNSDLFEGFSMDKVSRGRGRNVTTEFLREGPNVTNKGLGSGGRVQNVTDGSLEMEARAQNITGSEEVGSKNDSSTNSTKNSSPLMRSPADKLLDGILASEFDESSCLSRFQSYLYRKASPHKPSPYLISKLRNYEDLHKRCGPHSRSYSKTMKEVIGSRNHRATRMCNYIVWTPVNGLGNRMVSMGAAFLYAVLTDRVLLMQFENDMAGLFCEPFPNSSWTVPEDFPFRNNQRHVETYQNVLKADRKNTSKEVPVPPLVLHLNLQHTRDDPERFFHCDHSQDLLRKVPLLILQSDQYFVPSLFMIPRFNQELGKMFPEKDTVFHHLGRYLFHPSNEVWGPISRFYKAYLAKANEKIGLQIRVFNPDLTPYQTIMDQILRCTQKHKILPELETRNSVASPWKNQILKSVLVASLYPDYGENLRTMYLKKPTITGEIIGVYQPSHEEHQRFHDNMHNIKAWTEIYLLSLCDVLVTSSESSFGYVAQSLGALKPWVLNKLLDKNIPDSPCQRDFSMEPCFHFPPKHDCMAKSIKDLGTVFPHVRKCVDLRHGVKLVNDHE